MVAMKTIEGTAHGFFSFACSLTALSSSSSCVTLLGSPGKYPLPGLTYRRGKVTGRKILDCGWQIALEVLWKLKAFRACAPPVRPMFHHSNLNLSYSRALEGQAIAQVMHQTVREFFLRPHDSVVKSYFQTNLSAQPARSMIAITCIRYLDFHYGELVVRWFRFRPGFEDSLGLVQYLNNRPFIKYSLEYLTQRKEDVNADPLTLKPFSDLITNLQNCPSSLEFCLLRWLIGCGTHEKLNYLLGIAAENGYHVAAGTLLAGGAKCDDPIHRPLHRAAGAGHKAVVRLLLDRGARVEAEETNDERPLHRAAGAGHEAVVRLLLDRGAGTEAQEIYKETPLHQAAGAGQEATVRLLLDRGASIGSRNRECGTPLHRAAQDGDEAMVRLLLDRGANIEAKDSDNLTPLQKAIVARHQAVVRLLHDRGADVMAEAGDRGKFGPLLLQSLQPTGNECRTTAPPLFHVASSGEVCGSRQWPGPSNMLGSPAKRTWVFPSPGSASEANKRVKLDDERLV